MPGNVEAFVLTRSDNYLAIKEWIGGLAPMVGDRPEMNVVDASHTGQGGDGRPPRTRVDFR